MLPPLDLKQNSYNVESDQEMFNPKLKLLKPVIVICCIIAVTATIAALFWAFQEETRASMKDDYLVKPPFENTWFGMTHEEFCAALEITEDQLVPAAEFDTGKYWNLNSLAREYKVEEDELRFYENYENQYYLHWGEPLFESTDFFVDDQPSCVRVIFTNETTYKGKTIPPLLCAILLENPYNRNDPTKLTAAVDRYVYGIPLISYTGELSGAVELPENAKRFSLKQELTFKEAELLSYLYTSGMPAEVIEALDVLKMSDSEIEEMQSHIHKSIHQAIVHHHIRVSANTIYDHVGTAINDYIIMDAGYLAYYEWFLNELT